MVRLTFTNVGKLPPPVLQFSDVTFGYSKDKVLYSNVSAPLVASWTFSTPVQQSEGNPLYCNEVVWS